MKADIQPISITRSICDAIGAVCYYDKNNILWKKISGNWVGKTGIQVKPDGKGFQMKWQEEIKQTDILCK